jgi:hypothetical protein
MKTTDITKIEETESLTLTGILKHIDNVTASRKYVKIRAVDTGKRPFGTERYDYSAYRFYPDDKGFYYAPGFRWPPDVETLIRSGKNDLSDFLPRKDKVTGDFGSYFGDSLRITDYYNPDRPKKAGSGDRFSMESKPEDIQILITLPLSVLELDEEVLKLLREKPENLSPADAMRIKIATSSGFMCLCLLCNGYRVEGDNLILKLKDYDGRRDRSVDSSTFSKGKYDYSDFIMRELVETFKEDDSERIVLESFRKVENHGGLEVLPMEHWFDFEDYSGLRQIYLHEQTIIGHLRRFNMIYGSSLHEEFTQLPEYVSLLIDMKKRTTPEEKLPFPVTIEYAFPNSKVITDHEWEKIPRTSNDYRKAFRILKPVNIGPLKKEGTFLYISDETRDRLKKVEEGGVFKIDWDRLEKVVEETESIEVDGKTLRRPFFKRNIKPEMIF